MLDVVYKLKGIHSRAREGSHSTQATRWGLLELCAKQLHEEGFGIKSPEGLKPKHVEALVNRWMAEGLASGTIKNRMAALRWWGEKVGKASIFRDNEDYGIEARAGQGPCRSWTLDTARLERVTCPYVRYTLRLQAAFGLRREEAIKFMPSVADKGDRLVLRPSWCKGGRGRVIPVRGPRQRALLDELAAFCGGGSLIPPEKSYAAHLKTYKSQLAQAGLTNAHGLRHGYAQALYRALTGWAAPMVGGPAWRELSPEDRERDRWARSIISAELGHGRINVTNAYLGGRVPA